MFTRRRLAILLLSAPLVAIGYLWFTLLGPFGYAPPPSLPPIDERIEHRVFVYGTLRHAPVRWLVYGRAGQPAAARLPGFRKQGLDIVADAGATLDGLLLTVTADELRALDRYERLGIRYRRVSVTLDDGSEAWIYRRL